MSEIDNKKHLKVPSEGIPNEISSSATESSNTSTAGPLNLPTFTIDGDGIYSSTQANDKPLYEISHKLDGHWKGHVIGIVKVDRVNITGDNGKTRVKTRPKPLYDITRSHFWPHDFRIDAMRKGSYKKSHLRGNVTPGGVGVSGDGPSLSARPPMSSVVSFKHNDKLQWRDGDGRVIAVETMREWVGDGKEVMEATKPKLELKVELEEKLLDFLIVAWSTRNWKDARAVTYQPRTWEDIKRITSYSRTKQDLKPGPYSDFTAVMPYS